MFHEQAVDGVSRASRRGCFKSKEERAWQTIGGIDIGWALTSP